MLRESLRIETHKKWAVQRPITSLHRPHNSKTVKLFHSILNFFLRTPTLTAEISRMEIDNLLPQPRSVYMRIYLRSRYVSMTEHGLHRTEVRAPFYQVRSERVAQRVRADGLLYSGACRQILYYVEHRHTRQLTASLVQMKIDGHGRISLGRELLDRYSIAGEVVLVGVLDHFEIWEPKHYDEYFAESEANFEKLASESR